MTKFEAIFGIKEKDLKKTCILLPILRKDILTWLGVKRLSRGKLYGTGGSRHFTVIHTGMGPGLTGDAALYLDRTLCQDIILFGSCGLVKEGNGLNIGSLVTPDRCYSMEGFSDMLSKDKKEYTPSLPDKTLLERFPGQKKVTCATLASLKLEEDYIERFEEKNIQVVDMECSALFSASRHVKKRAIAFFYITDIINKKPYYKDLSHLDKSILLASIKSAANILCKFTEKNPED